MEIALVVILVVLVIALFVVSYMKKKKYTAELGQMREELKNGDKVMTDTGVVGEVVDSYIEDEYKYFVLKTGKGQNIGYFTVHANAIYYVFGKEDAPTNGQTKKVKVSVNTAKTDASQPVSASDDASKKGAASPEGESAATQTADTASTAESADTTKVKEKK